MKKLLSFLFFLLPVFSSGAYAGCRVPQDCGDETVCFLVTKIVDSGGIYTIYAERGELKYQIVSLKSNQSGFLASLPPEDYEEIKEGGCYSFKINSLNQRFYATELMGWILPADAIYYLEGDVPIQKDGGYDDIYFAQNIFDRYYLKGGQEVETNMLEKVKIDGKIRNIHPNAPIRYLDSLDVPKSYLVTKIVPSERYYSIYVKGAGRKFLIISRKPDLKDFLAPLRPEDYEMIEEGRCYAFKLSSCAEQIAVVNAPFGCLEIYLEGGIRIDADPDYYYYYFAENLIDFYYLKNGIKVKTKASPHEYREYQKITPEFYE